MPINKIQPYHIDTSNTFQFASVNVNGNATLRNTTIAGNLIPSANNQYSMGSPTMMFKDMYIGPGSLYVNGVKVLEEASNSMIFSASSNQNIRLSTTGTGDIELNPDGTGVIAVQGPLQIDSAHNITSSDGNAIKLSNPLRVDSISSLTANAELVLSGNGSGNVKITGDATITGNLTIQGTSGNLSVTTLSVQDNIIDLSAETTGVPSNNAGLRVIRGDDPATQLRWNETSDTWQFTTDGSTYLDIIGKTNTGNVNGINYITSNYFVGNGSSLSSITGSNVNGQVSFAATANSVALANVVGIGNLASINRDGNASNVLYGNGVFAAPTGGTGSYGNSNVATFLASFGSNTITTTGNIAAGNANLGNAVRANFFVGNGAFLTGVDLLTVGNADVANRIANGTSNVNIPSVNGNVTIGVNGTNNVAIITSNEILVGGNLVATGNVGGNFILGNGSLLTGVAKATSAVSVANGTTNLNVPLANGNVAFAVGGTPNVVIITPTGSNISGYVTATGNITGNYILGNGSLLTGITATTATSSDTANTANIANTANSATTAGTVTTNAQPNITSLGTLSNLTSNGTVNFSGSSNVSLGPVGNIRITGGSSGQVLSTDGTGNLSWVTSSGTSLNFLLTKSDFPGTLSIFNGVNRFYCYNNSSIKFAQMYATNPPTGSAANVRINLNGSPVANVSLTSGSSYTLANLNIPVVVGDYITMDVTAIGSINPGQNVSVQIVAGQ